jgi:hypothetical protein
MVCLTPAAAALLLLVVVLAAAVSALPAINVTTMAFEDGYAPLFGHGNILRSADHRTVSLLLDRSTGGFTYIHAIYASFVCFHICVDDALSMHRVHRSVQTTYIQI